MHYPRICKFVFSVAALFAVILPARAQQVLLNADAQINSASPAINYGAAQSLAVNSTTSTILRYDLTDILPANVTAAQVSKARLIIFPNTVTTKGNFNVYALTSAFSESTVTYATRPKIGATREVTAAISGAFDPIQIQLTSTVQDWVGNPASNHGLELVAVGGTSFAIDSKENTGTSHPAILLIDLLAPAGPTGPQGPAGAKGSTGATGPQGPAGGLPLPYAVAANDERVVALTVTNTGTSGGAIMGIGGPSGIVIGGIGLFGQGGAGVAANIMGGPGVVGAGGNATAAATGGGLGSFFSGGNAPFSETVAGNGIEVHGGAADTAGFGGYAILAVQGTNATAAGVFVGDVSVEGMLSKSSGAFKIDHPLDPEGKYLYHSFVESPDMKNVYDGNVVTDGQGFAQIAMPDWFEALNSDFRYQLTTIGQPAQAWIATEIQDNHFTIRTDKPGVKVSWQVTGIRHDAWANAHRIPLEVEKNEKEKGHYIHPELFGHPGEPSAQEMEHPVARRTSPPVQ